MAFIRLDGWDPTVLIDGFDHEDESVESFSRAVSDDYVGVTYSEKQGYSFMTRPVGPVDAESIAGWVRGRGHRWRFQTTSNGTTAFTLGSADSGLTLTAGSANADGLFGSNGLLLNSGATSCATAAFGSEGNWTAQLYHRVSGGSFVSYVIRSKSGVVDFWASAATTAGVSVATVSAASGFLGLSLLGRNSAGTNATAQFDGVRLVPYALLDSQIASLATPFLGLPSSGFSKPPYVVVTGTGIVQGGPPINGASERGGQAYKGFVESFDVVPSILPGEGYDAGSRMVKIRLVQR